MFEDGNLTCAHPQASNGAHRALGMCTCSTRANLIALRAFSRPKRAAVWRREGSETRENNIPQRQSLKNKAGGKHRGNVMRLG